MALAVQIAIDCADPAALGGFWALALDYVEDPPPPGFASWDAALDAFGVQGEARTSDYAVVDPDGVGPRLFFHRVPEGKTAKNRLHLDVRAGGPRGTPDEHRWSRITGAAERLEAAGATRLREQKDEVDHFLVMADPEGNEFCLT